MESRMGMGRRTPLKDSSVSELHFYQGLG